MRKEIESWWVISRWRELARNILAKIHLSSSQAVPFALPTFIVKFHFSRHKELRRGYFHDKHRFGPTANRFQCFTASSVNATFRKRLATLYFSINTDTIVLTFFSFIFTKKNCHLTYKYILAWMFPKQNTCTVRHWASIAKNMCVYTRYIQEQSVLSLLSLYHSL